MSRRRNVRLTNFVSCQYGIAAAMADFSQGSSRLGEGFEANPGNCLLFGIGIVRDQTDTRRPIIIPTAVKATRLFGSAKWPFSFGCHVVNGVHVGASPHVARRVTIEPDSRPRPPPASTQFPLRHQTQERDAITAKSPSPEQFGGGYLSRSLWLAGVTALPPCRSGSLSVACAAFSHSLALAFWRSVPRPSSVIFRPSAI